MEERTLIKKLGIKPGYMEKLGTLPVDTEVKVNTEGTFDFVQLFIYNKANLDSYAFGATQALKRGGVLWFSYPKKSSKVKADITRDVG